MNRSAVRVQIMMTLTGCIHECESGDKKHSCTNPVDCVTLVLGLVQHRCEGTCDGRLICWTFFFVFVFLVFELW